MVCFTNSVPFLVLLTIIEVFSQNYTLWKQNYEIFKEFSCDIPRPVVFPIVEVFPSNTSKRYLDKLDPKFVVLHRCGRHSGCCLDIFDVCKENPNEVEQVKITFLNTDIPASQARAFRYHVFTNHTSCSCQSKTSNDDSKM